MTQRTPSKRRPRQDPSAPTLKQRAADLRASMPARGSKASAPPSPQAAPDPDAVLVDAAADLQRLEAEIAAIPSIEGRSLDEAPGYADLDAEVERVTGTLANTAAVGLPGLQAKAKAILSDRFSVQSSEELEMAHSLARDVLSAAPAVFPPRARAEPAEESDPVFALIDAHHAAYCTWDAAYATVGNRHPSDPGLNEARRATIPLSHAEEQAFMAMVGSLPTSLPGLMALADYLPGALTLRGANEVDDEAALALGAICASIRALVAKGKIVVGDGAPAMGANLRPMADPIFAAIRETERLQAMVDAASVLPQPPGTIDPLPEQQAAFHAFNRHVDTVLAATVPTTATGCAALARFIASYPRHRGFVLDENDEGQHLRILDNIALSPALVAGQPALQHEGLAAAILNHWPVWAAKQRDVDAPAAESVEERRLALIEAAAALPATKETIVTKSLALAWLDYVDNWRAGWTRDDHTTDGRLALDIHAALTGALATEKAFHPAAPEFTGQFADRINFASATIRELVAVHDTAKLVGDVAQAAVWQGRCKDSGAGNPYVPSYNAAGALMAWLSDELTHVESLAVDEMKKRRPINLLDRERRLAWIAAPIIQNSDTTETAAFIGDLATWLADDRGT